jgi:hypothetical protein
MKLLLQITLLMGLLFGTALNLSSQVAELYMVTVKGKVISAETGEPVSYAHVINPRAHGGTTTNSEGIFTINMLTEDTLTVRAVGFVDSKFFVTEFPPKPLYEIKLKPQRYLLNEVTVSEKSALRKSLGLPEAKPLDIPVEYRGDSYNENPSVLAAVFSPLSYLQYKTSDKEKDKRATRNAIQNQKEWAQFSRYHNLRTIKRLTGLSGPDAEEFMIYCNINNRLPYNASQMEIEFQIMSLFFEYKKEKEGEEKAGKE